MHHFFTPELLEKYSAVALGMGFLVLFGLLKADIHTVTLAALSLTEPCPLRCLLLDLDTKLVNTHSLPCTQMNLLLAGKQLNV